MYIYRNGKFTAFTTLSQTGTFQGCYNLLLYVVLIDISIGDALTSFPEAVAH